MSPPTNASQQSLLARVWLFENCSQNSLERELGHYGASGHHGDTPEYHVFHVEFERVEIPFIIALWIFVSSLAKIGKYLATEFCFHEMSVQCNVIELNIVMGYL